jgi:hypothetical protein
MKRITLSIIVLLLSITAISLAQNSKDPGKPDQVFFDSITVKAESSFIMPVMVFADDTTTYNEKKWPGVGSFCIPLKYDSKSLKIDSVKFVGTIAEWDERFTNPKIDTGFVSFAGLHNIGGKENPVFLTTEGPQEIARIFGSIRKEAKSGVYLLELTIDPIQREMYLGSIDGVHGWKPDFRPGKVVVE